MVEGVERETHTHTHTETETETDRDRDRQKDLSGNSLTLGAWVRENFNRQGALKSPLSLC